MSGPVAARYEIVDALVEALDRAEARLGRMGEWTDVDHDGSLAALGDEQARLRAALAGVRGDGSQGSLRAWLRARHASRALGLFVSRPDGRMTLTGPAVIDSRRDAAYAHLSAHHVPYRAVRVLASNDSAVIAWTDERILLITAHPTTPGGPS